MLELYHTIHIYKVHKRRCNMRPVNTPIPNLDFNFDSDKPETHRFGFLSRSGFPVLLQDSETETDSLSYLILQILRNMNRAFCSQQCRRTAHQVCKEGKRRCSRLIVFCLLSLFPCLFLKLSLPHVFFIKLAK